MAYRFHEDEHGEVVAEMRRRGSSPKIPLNINYDCERKGSLQREAERETVRRRQIGFPGGERHVGRMQAQGGMRSPRCQYKFYFIKKKKKKKNFFNFN
jgi:hypothetical protein